MSNIQIREAMRDDVARLHQIAHAAYQHYTPRMGRDPAPMHADFAMHLNADTVFVMERDDFGLCGYAVMIADDHGWLLDNIAIAPTAQGQGLGGRLLAHCEAFLQAKDVAVYSLYTNAAMHENIIWYQARGFHETERRTENGFHRIYMEKSLA